jgi:outer membrane lipoprotein SlyB
MDIHNRPKLLYPSMVIAAIAVTVFSLLGIATLTGALPFAHSESKENIVASEGQTAASSEENAPVPGDRKIAFDCASCGTVESVRAVEVKGEGSGVGAVAGGLAGALLGNGIGHGNGRAVATVIGGAGGAYAGNEIEKSTKKHTSYRIRVQMANGGIRTVYQRDVPGVAAGDRVKIVDGAIVALS